MIRAFSFGQTGQASQRADYSLYLRLAGTAPYAGMHFMCQLLLNRIASAATGSPLTCPTAPLRRFVQECRAAEIRMSVDADPRGADVTAVAELA